MADAHKDELNALRRAIGKDRLVSAADLLTGRKRSPRRHGRPTGKATDQPAGLVEACGGQEASIGRWKYHLLRHSLAEALPDDLYVAAEYAAVMRGARQRFDELEASAGLCIAANARGEELLFVSLETCGRGEGVFLAGMMYFANDQLIFEQCLARSRQEEPGILQAVLDRVAGVSLVVTFDGRTRDMEVIRRRAEDLPISMPGRMPANLNLRAQFRRQWKGRLKSFSLAALEQFFFGRRRTAPVDRAAIPGIYRHFLETADASPLRRVLECNLLDLLTMVQLLCAALTGYEPADD